DPGRPTDHDVRSDPGIVADLDVGPDDGVRPDRYIFPELCRGVDDRCRMDHWSLFLIAQRTSHSAASCPSTKARASNIQMPRIRRFSLASSRNWSPGTTGRLKRQLSTDTSTKMPFGISGLFWAWVRNASTPQACAMDSISSTP